MALRTIKSPVNGVVVGTANQEVLAGRADQDAAFGAAGEPIVAITANQDDPTAAALFGVDPKRAVSVATLLGGGLAGFAGLLAVLHFGNMSFGSGFVYGLKVLFIASVGGLSRPAAVAGGAFLFGEAEALWDGYFPIATREMVFFVFLAALLCLRPGGRVSIERV